MTIEDLIEKHHGERTFFDHELLGVYFTMKNLEAFTKQAVEDFKESLEPVAWMYVSSSTSCDKLSLDRPTKGFIPNTEFELYALGEAK